MRNFSSFLLFFLCLVSTVFVGASCNSGSDAVSSATNERVDTSTATPNDPAAVNSTNAPVVIADAAAIIARKEVPILCYHQIRDYKPSDSKTARAYIVPVARFREQMQSLADSGYHTILPDQLFTYLTTGTALPPKPVMITFDDTRLDQYTVAVPELSRHNYKGVYFIMTVSLNRPGYMTNEQVKEISDAGNTIGSHTWDHHNVRKYEGEDWKTQIEKPSKKLAEITGKSVDYFAYPFGLWNKQAIAGLKPFNFKSAFQLADARDDVDPLYSIRRIIVPGDWTASTLQSVMQRSFK